MHLIMGWLNLRWREDTKWRHISSHISTHLLLCYAVAVAIKSNCGRVVKLMRWRVSGVLNPGILYYSVGCSIGTMRCVDINGNPILDRRSRFYQECNTGRWSGVMLAPEEKICYLNTLLLWNDGSSTGVHLLGVSLRRFRRDYHGYCVYFTVCLGLALSCRIVLCQNGFLSSPINVISTGSRRPDT